MEQNVVHGIGDSMVALPLSLDITVHYYVRCHELQIWLKLHKLLQNHPLPLSSLHPFMPSVVRGVHMVCLVHHHLCVCSHSPRCTPQEMLNVYLEVVISEVAEVLEKFMSELEFGGQGKWFLLLKHFPHIGINKLFPMVPLNELFPHGKVFFLHSYHSQLAFDISRPNDSLPLLLGVNVLELTDDQRYKSLHRRSS